MVMVVAVLDYRQCAADIGFRRDVADHETVGAAGETAVGDQRDVLAQAFAHDGGGGREHFAHAGAAFGAFVADDDDIAFDDVAVQNALQRLFFGIEHFGLAGETQAFLAGDFGDRAFGGQIAVQHDQMAVFLDRIDPAT